MQAHVTKSQASSLLGKPSDLRRSSAGTVKSLRRSQSALHGGCLRSCLRAVKGDALIVATLVAVVLGVGFGFILKELNPSEDLLTWIGM